MTLGRAVQQSFADAASCSINMFDVSTLAGFQREIVSNGLYHARGIDACNIWIG